MAADAKVDNVCVVAMEDDAHVIIDMVMEVEYVGSVALEPVV